MYRKWKKKKKVKKKNRVLWTLAIDSFPKPAPIIRKKIARVLASSKTRRVKFTYDDHCFARSQVYLFRLA